MSHALVLLLAALLFQVGAAQATAEDKPPDEDRIPGLVLFAPLPGQVTRPFDPPEQVWGRGHRGVDLSGSPGDPVRSGAGGTVSFVGMVAGRPVVTIDHGNGVQTTHEPVEATVRRGQQVRAGEVIGHLATGGGHTGALHWGLKWHGRYHDPLLYLAAPTTGPIRLLPLDARPAPVTSAPLAGALVGGPGSPAQLTGGIPVSGPITSRFGMRFHPVLRVWKLHDGVDFGAPCGSPIRSVGAGTVVEAGMVGGYGNWVVVDVGGGRRYGYAHLSSFGVRPGQRVANGGYLGAVGSTGYSTGCHLHFMAWQDGRVVPPPVPR